MNVIERDESERCPKCGKPSASPPAEVYCVECATEDWQEDAIAHLRHQLAGAVSGVVAWLREQATGERTEDPGSDQLELIADFIERHHPAGGQ